MRVHTHRNGAVINEHNHITRLPLRHPEETEDGDPSDWPEDYPRRRRPVVGLAIVIVVLALCALFAACAVFLPWRRG
jgi:hypothetical protein